MKLHDFYIGNAFDAYTFFGAHIQAEGVVFRTYAPGAAKVGLVGEFNAWQDTPMQQDRQSGVYTCHVPKAKAGMLYKYRIYRQDGGVVDHADPYGFGMQLRPDSASVIIQLGGYAFGDAAWMQSRNKRYDSPFNIYEVHLGSWRTNPKDENGWFTYEEIADPLISYVKENGYNYIEFMPLGEHPLDASWGYQSTGFFSPTARYGTARGLMELVDKCHRAGVGVIMDFVPVHFAVDYYGLSEYDGTPLYEYPSNDVRVSEWGSHNFIHSRGEVCSFLQSAANYWLTEYHFDGIRMDAISRMIYWQGEPHRGVNHNSVHFIKTMNEGLHALHPTAILIAEDSTDYPKVTAPVEYGGLGFDYKWDLGWMNDTLDYFKKTPEERVEYYNKLTFSMMYFYNELYLLPLSHDEVVHGKATILQKMHGEYEGKFKQARAMYTYMVAHPGKKLNFMGNEFGQLREWDEKREQDWDILRYPLHDAFHRFIIDLNRLYNENDALYSGDYDSARFRWLDIWQHEKCVYIFQRCSKSNLVMAAFNFSDKPQQEFVLELEHAAVVRPVLNSDWDVYGGDTPLDKSPLQTDCGEEGCTLHLALPAYTGILYAMEQTQAAPPQAQPQAQGEKP